METSGSNPGDALFCAEQNTSPDALVLAVLCDFRDRSPRAVIRYILDRLQVLTEGTPARFRDYLKRSSRRIQTMLSEVLITELPSYGLGMERGMERGIEQGLTRGMQRGMEQGMERGEQLMLSRLLQKRFGPLPPPDSGPPGSCQHHRTGSLGRAGAG